MADNNNQQQPAAEEAAKLWLPLPGFSKDLCGWVLANAILFGGVFSIAFLIDDHAATADDRHRLRFLLYGELGCSVAAALAAPLHVLLLLNITTRRCWAAVVDVFAWVALTATAGIHCLEIARAGGKHKISYVMVMCFCLAADLGFAGVLLCCSPTRRRLDEMGEQQGDDHGDGDVGEV